ncbi:MAG: FtsX-like permease family protein [Coprococcus sp.]
MTFARIALKNVRKKFGSYLIYFFSTTFSVFIFNLFCAIYYNPEFENYRFGTGKMSALFRGAAIAVFLFAAVFVMYSGSYFIKTQKKEIALYSLLGMRKGYIALMMFLETFFIGLLSVVFGSVIGTLSSSYCTSLLLRITGMGTKVSFSVNPQALIATITAFLVLFVVNGIHAYQTIYKYSLLELLSATKKREESPTFSSGCALISVLLLGVGYVISATMKVDVGGIHLMGPIFIAAVCILTGTFLLFRSFVPMVIFALKKRKALYYKTSNFISISQIAFRLNANSRMLAVISLLTAITITMISASYSFYSGIGGTATKCYAPYSYLAKNITDEQYDKIIETVSDIGEVQITSTNKIELIHVSMENDNYAVKDQQTGEVTKGAVNGYLMSQSMYLKIIDETNTPKGSYSETKSDFEGGLTDSSCYFIDGNAIEDYCKNLVGQQINVDFNGENKSYTIDGTGLHKYIGALDLYKCPTIVVSDDIYKQYYGKTTPDSIDTFYAFQFDDDMMSSATVKAINQFIPERFHIGSMPGNMSFIEIYKANFALFGSYAFIGFFLGVLFLLASGSIMYYKLIMEAQEETPRYGILWKIGMKKNEVYASVAKQLGLVYGLPLIVGMIHMVFGLWFYNRALGDVAGEMAAFRTALMVALLFVLVYGLFYLLSVVNYYRIIWKNTAITE